MPVFEILWYSQQGLSASQHIIFYSPVFLSFESELNDWSTCRHVDKLITKMKKGEPIKERRIKQMTSKKEISAESLAESDGQGCGSQLVTPLQLFPLFTASIPDDSISFPLTYLSSPAPTTTLIHSGRHLSQSICDFKVQSWKVLGWLIDAVHKYQIPLISTWGMRWLGD